MCAELVPYGAGHVMAVATLIDRPDSVCRAGTPEQSADCLRPLANVGVGGYWVMSPFDIVAWQNNE